MPYLLAIFYAGSLFPPRKIPDDNGGASWRIAANPGTWLLDLFPPALS